MRVVRALVDIRARTSYFFTVKIFFSSAVKVAFIFPLLTFNAKPFDPCHHLQITTFQKPSDASDRFCLSNPLSIFSTFFYSYYYHSSISVTVFCWFSFFVSFLLFFHYFSLYSYFFSLPSFLSILLSFFHLLRNTHSSLFPALFSCF